LAKAHYLAGKVNRQFDAPFFNEFVANTNGKSPDQVNAELAEKKIIGGLPLGRFYPELKGSMLLCATEMNKREDMDTVASVLGAH
jgi:glycine dehydrogenase subunit 1